MSIRLIINSDDYGRSSGVSRGIRDAHTKGVVTSTTCLMNFPNTEDDIVATLRETPNLGMGVHLVLTTGYPLLPTGQIPSLVDPNGAFFKLEPFMTRMHVLNPAEAKAEWRAQIERFLDITGRRPTHLDSHHHASYFTEGLFRAMLELAAEYRCPIRRADAHEDAGMAGLLQEFAPRMADAFYSSFYDEMATKDELLRIIGDLPEGGIYELMCHPGYADEDLIASTIYARQREKELDILTDSDIRQAIEERQIELVTFVDL